MFRQLGGMIGRDKFLSKEVYPRCKSKEIPFVLEGARGIGKSAILLWAYQYGKEPKAFISAADRVKESLLNIVDQWGLQVWDGEKKIPLQRAKIAELENTILKQPGGSIYIDDIQRATPSFLKRFKVWRERFKTYCAGVPPFKKEELKRNLWGLTRLHVEPIEKKYRFEFAKKACEKYGSFESPSEIAHNSRGYHGRIISMANGNIEVEPQRVQGEELDLSPALFLIVAGILALRFIGRGMDDTALYILGGLGMALVIVLRFFLYRGIK